MIARERRVARPGVEATPRQAVARAHGEARKALERVDVDAGKPLGMIGCDLLDLDPSLRREHEQRLAHASVECRREVVLGGDRTGGLQPDQPRPACPPITSPKISAASAAVRAADRPQASPLRPYHGRRSSTCACQHNAAADGRCGSDRLGLVGGGRESPLRDGNSVASEKLFPLVLIKVHGATVPPRREPPKTRPYPPEAMTIADQLTAVRIASAPLVVVLFAVHFGAHDYWATGAFCVAMSTDWFDGRIARRSGRTSSFGSLLDPVADKVLVLATLCVLLDQHPSSRPGWSRRSWRASS